MKKKFLSLALAATLFFTSALAINSPESVFAADVALVETEDNGSFATANEVNITGQGTYDFSGTITYTKYASKGEDDYIKLVIANPGKVSINVTSSIENAIVITTYEADQTTLLHDIVGKKEPIYSGYCHPAASVFYLELTAYQQKDVSYTVTITEDESKIYEQEKNDTPETANVLVDGQAVNGIIQTLEDHDCYRLDVPKNCYAEVVLAPVDPVDVSQFVTGWSYDIEKPAESITEFSKGYTTATNIAFKGVTKLYAGTYYISIHSLDTKNVNTYSLTTYINKFNSPKVKKVSSKKNSVTVTWEKNTEVTGYQVSYSTSKKFKKSKTITISKNSTAKSVIKKLSANKKYYVRVRSFVTVEKKNYYSDWSKTKEIKTKK